MVPSTRKTETQAVSEVMQGGQGATLEELGPSVFAYRGKSGFIEILPSRWALYMEERDE